MLDKILNSVVHKYAGMPTLYESKGATWTREYAKTLQRPQGDYTELPTETPDLQGVVGEAQRLYFSRGDYQGGIDFIVCAEKRMGQLGNKSDDFHDAVAYAVAWALVQMGRTHSELKPLLQYARGNIARARVIMLIAIIMLYEHDSSEVHPDVVKGINVAKQLAPYDDEVFRLEKVAVDLNKFIKVQHVHYLNLKKIVVYASQNRLDVAKFIKEKEDEIGYKLTEPTFSYKLHPRDFIGTSFIGEPVTVHRPQLSGGLNFIDAVLYINLAHRTDRDAECRAELIPVFGEDKVQRFNATQCKERPLRGCNTSHVRALLYAEEQQWRTVLICEDDCQLTITEEEVDSHLAECFRSCSEMSEGVDDGWDVIMFGGYYPHCKSTSSPHLKQTHCATASHCYLVHSNYFRTLSEHIQRCTEIDLQFDLGWWSLQHRDRWFVTDPIIAVQRDSLSDVTGNGSIETNMMAKTVWDTKMVVSNLRSFTPYKVGVTN